MPKKIDPIEVQTILNALGVLPKMSLDELHKALPVELSKRTLQRRLVLLEQQGQVNISKAGRSTYYSIPVAEQKKPSLKELVTLSSEGEEILLKVTQPLAQRLPVGYQREFLDAYRPNETYYLDEATRNELYELGCIKETIEPAGTYARQILQRLLIDLSWNSSRLEGNTYSLLETQNLLEMGQAAQGKDAQETQMILNHKLAIEFLVEAADQIGFNRYTVLNLHGLLSDNLLEDPRGSGCLRAAPVGIGGSVYHPLEVPSLIDECFEQILETASTIQDPFEQSFFSMVHLPYLQPFIDVNKRVSRLAANIPLIAHNLCPLSFVDLPKEAYIDAIVGVYELNQIDLLKDIFVWAYRRSTARYSAVRQSLGQPNLLKLHYRDTLIEAVQTIVSAPMSRQQALDYLRVQAQEKVSQEHRERFIELTETELMSLHEGNIARFRIRLSEYHAWQAQW